MNPSQLALCRVAVILGRDLTARLDDMLAPVDLTELEYRLLVTLYSRKGCASPGELGVALVQSPANLTRMGDLMVARGLITRRPDETDRRRMLLELTDCRNAARAASAAAGRQAGFEVLRRFHRQRNRSASWSISSGSSRRWMHCPPRTPRSAARCARQHDSEAAVALPRR